PEMGYDGTDRTIIELAIYFSLKFTRAAPSSVKETSPETQVTRSITKSLSERMFCTASPKVAAFKRSRK
ncbi:hypothetical protein D5086_010032, partial [Populus alba]